LQPYIENILGECQAGFRSGRSTTNQLFTIKQILEKSWWCNINVYQIYVDFKQAYDSVYQEKIYKIMHEFGIPDKLTSLVRTIMTDTDAQVKIQTQLTDPCVIKWGLKQGDGLAPSLFNLAMENIIRKLTLNVKGTLEHHTTQIIGYTDDICLLSRNCRAIQEMYQELREAANEVRLKIKVNKTQAIIRNRSKTKSNSEQQVNIGENKIDIVSSFNYLGSCITEDNNEFAEIQRRLKLANNTYYSLQAVIKRWHICRKTKIRLYKTLIRTVLTYGCETWSVSKKSENAINTFERKILR
jgi:sorting nexin-29